MLKSCKIYACASGTLGLHLSRAPWDPYPWISGVQKGSSAYNAGMRIGDTVLELNGCDILGQKIFEVATHIREHWQSGATYVTVVIWRNKAISGSGDSNGGVGAYGAGEEHGNVDDDDDDDDDENTQHHGINQQSLQKFATCLQHIAQLLECPVCLEVIKPPGWQCCNGHVLCNNCRSRSLKCPVCRVPLGPRGRCLLSDKLFTLLAESFPCDGVKSNKNSPNARRKCSPEYHSHPKMAIGTMHEHEQQQQQHSHQQQIKAKEIKKKVKVLRQHEKAEDKVDKDLAAAAAVALEKQATMQGKDVEVATKLSVAAATTNEIYEVKLQLVKGERIEGSGGEENVKIPSNDDASSKNNSNNNNNTINNFPSSVCMQRTSRTTKVHQQQQQHQLNEMKILKSYEVEQQQTQQQQQQQQSSNNYSFSEIVNEEKNLTVSTSSSSSSSNINVAAQETSNDNNVLVKLKLNSSKKSADYNNNSYNNKTAIFVCKQQATTESHELQKDKVTIVNNGMLTNKVQHQEWHQQKQQQEQQQQKEQLQQYQNYHCPTGKSCCSYVKTSTTVPMGVTMNCNTNNNNNNNNNKSNVLSTAWDIKSAGQQMTKDTVAAAAADPATMNSLMFSRATSKLSSNDHSLSCNNKTWTAAELQQQQERVLETRNRQQLPKAAAPTAYTSIYLKENRNQSKLFENEWQILAHLTREHHLPVSHFYGTYCQRIQVDFMHNKSMACLQLAIQQQHQQQQREPEQQQWHQTNVNILNYETVNNYKVQKFFLASIPLEEIGGYNNSNNEDVATTNVMHILTTYAKKYAIFLWHLSDESSDVAAAAIHASHVFEGNTQSPPSLSLVPNSSSSFVTIIESKRTGIKWFGYSHSLTKSWSQIHAEGDFLVHEMSPSNTQQHELVDTFDIVIKIK